MPILKELMKNYEDHKYRGGDKILSETCVETDKPVFRRLGMTDEDALQHLDDIVIYPSDYFNPKSFETQKITLTPNTVGIHHYTRSWHDETEKIICEKYHYFIANYELSEAKQRFGRWYRRNRLRLVFKRYGVFGTLKKLCSGFSA